MSVCRCSNCSRARKPCWYKTKEWKRTAPAVVQRDRQRCLIVEGCARRATVADHILEVHPDMPWHEFIAMSNLRAGCHFHNTRRGMAARLEREMRDGLQLIRRPSLVSRGRSLMGGRTG